MLCPYCNKEMKIGEIVPKHGLGHSPIIAPHLYIDEEQQIPLTAGRLTPLSLWVGEKFPCYYCLDCRKILLDIPEEL